MRSLNLFLLFFFLFSINSYSLPPCEGYSVLSWDNCEGTETFANGNKYVGEYKNGLPNGKGTFTFASGSKYVGEWKDGKYHGKGTFTSAEGKSTSGKYVDGKKVGRHIEINY